MLGIGTVQLPCSGECVRMWGGVHEGSGWGLCGLFGESSSSKGMQSEFHSLLFCSISWTVVFGLTGEFIWKELKRIGVEDLNNLWG